MERLIKWDGTRYGEKTIPSEPMAKVPAPGPYTLETFRDGVDDCWSISDRDGNQIAYYGFWDDGNGKSDQIEANLKLLAASPELLEALILLMEACSWLPWSLFTGRFFKAMAKVESIILRLFGRNGWKNFNSWRNSIRSLGFGMRV